MRDCTHVSCLNLNLKRRITQYRQQSKQHNTAFFQKIITNASLQMHLNLVPDYFKFVFLGFVPNLIRHENKVRSRRFVSGFSNDNVNVNWAVHCCYQVNGRVCIAKRTNALLLSGWRSQKLL